MCGIFVTQAHLVNIFVYNYYVTFGDAIAHLYTQAHFLPTLNAEKMLALALLLLLINLTIVQSTQDTPLI